jgi:hypothetical protein
VTLQHIVLFSFPDALEPADAAEMRAQITAWPGVIPGIRALRFGEDITGERTRGYQYLLYTEFDDEDTLRAYQGHPVHQRFLQWVLDRSCTPLAFDYHLTNGTVILG